MSFSVSFSNMTHSRQLPTLPLFPVSARHYGRGQIGVLFLFLSVLTPLRIRLPEEVPISMLKAPDSSPDKLKVELQRTGWLICEVFLPLYVQPVAEKLERQRHTGTPWTIPVSQWQLETRRWLFAAACSGIIR